MTLQHARPLVSRTSRVERLADALSTKPLVAVAAPAGYGKTSLVGLALESYGKPSASVGRLVEAIKESRR